MRIGVDVTSGDYAPQNIVLGAINSLKYISPKTRIVLFGNKENIFSVCSSQKVDPINFDIVHSTQSITMDDHPVKSYNSKPDSGIVKGFDFLRRGEIHSFASCGNTGAMLTGCVTILKTLPGILRPCISAELPVYGGRRVLLLDVGFNTDCRPDVLYQFGLLGSVYAKQMMGIVNPKVAILNIGEEKDKGNMSVKEAYNLMSDSIHFNFCGNIESNHLYLDPVADVIVADGFVGNIILKQIEGTYSLLKKLNIEESFLERLNYEYYGGTPVLGVASPVIIAHGASSPLAVTNMILQSERSLINNLVVKFKEMLSYEQRY